LKIFFFHFPISSTFIFQGRRLINKRRRRRHRQSLNALKGEKESVKRELNLFKGYCRRPKGWRRHHRRHQSDGKEMFIISSNLHVACRLLSSHHRRQLSVPTTFSISIDRSSGLAIPLLLRACSVVRHHTHARTNKKL
jgi:hypothetical protein